jgi:hypothetical protein
MEKSNKALHGDAVTARVNAGVGDMEITDTEQKDRLAFSGYPSVSAYLSMLDAVYPQRWWSSSGIILIVCVVVGGALVLKDSIPLSVALPAMVGTGAFIMLAVWLGTSLRTRDRRNAYDRAVSQEPRTGWVDADGVHLQIQSGRSDLEWAYFTRLVRTAHGLGLCKDKQLVDVFVPSMFASPQAWEAARQIVETKLGESPTSGPTVRATARP